jgi:hypothetical protein
VVTAKAEGDSGRLYVFNADGSLLWEVPAPDNSAGSSSAIDLDGDGIWEIVWNGQDQGLTIFRGSDGAILYNESKIKSMTRMDYPIIADVDGDGAAEIVTGNPTGVYIVGHDSMWAPSRPLWNQYNYHVTNIADDLSVPPVEPPSWLVHNTYRTQSPLQDVLPVYQINLTHTVPISRMVVLSSTFSYPPDTPAPAYHWRYDQRWYEPLRVTRFDAQLPGMQPGEVRRVSEDTELAYRLASGSNRLSLPPLYATAAHIVALTPPTHTTTPGGQAEYQVTLRNLAAEPAVYTLTLAGLPDQWATVDGLALPAMIAVDAQTSVTLPLAFNVPDGAEPASHDFALATTPSDVVDSAQGQLVVADALEIGVSPMWTALDYGDTLTYTVIVTNLEAIAREYTLDVTGLENSLVDVPSTVVISGYSTATVSMTVTVLEPVGQHLMQVSAGYEQDGATIRAREETVLHVLNEPGVSVALAPVTAVAGLASPAIFTMTITNTGSVADTYTLTVELPAGWEARWRANQLHYQSLPTTLSLTPHLFNSANLHLALTPPAGTPPGTYPVTLWAYSSIDASIFARAVGYVEVVDRGVTVSISPATTTMHPQSSQSWDVTITNTGGQADTFDLTAGGIISPAGSFNQDAVTLATGSSTVVQFTAHEPTYVLAQTYPLGVLARSRSVPEVFGDDVADVTFSSFEDVAVSITPTMQTLTDTLTAHVLVAITNTGNVGTVYKFDADATPALAGLGLEIGELYMPPHMTAHILVTAHASHEGMHTLILQATSEHATAMGTAQVTFGESNVDHLTVYLPVMMCNH